MRGWMAGRREISVEERKDIYAKEWGVESGDNPVTPWYAGS